MNALAQTSLAFARECLEWERPVDRRFAEQNRNAVGDGGSRAWTPYIFDYDGKRDQLHYTDLNVVMKAVQGWVKQNDVRGYLSVTRHGYCFAVHRRTLSGEITDEDRIATECDANPSHALLAACVDASRKLKAAG